MSYFKDAKVGDKVYCLLHGHGEIIEVLSSNRLEVKFDRDGRVNVYDSSGSSRGVYNQTLYWSKPEIIAPPKPKRKVKKTVTGYVLVHHSTKLVASDELYTSFESCLGDSKLMLGTYEIATVTYEIEIEE